jgi:hypothetical protein
MLPKQVFHIVFRSAENARKVFGETQERDVVSWTSMISAFAHVVCGMIP